MKTIIFFISIIVAGFILNSCLVFQGGGMTKRGTTGSSAMIRAKRFTDSGNTVFNSFYDASRRSTVIVANKDNFTVLAENNPDAIFSKTLDIVAKFSQKDNLSAEAGLNFASTALQLNKKSSANLFVSDALYRLNEMYLNTLNIDKIINDKDKNEINIRTSVTIAQRLTNTFYTELFKEILTKSVELSKYELELSQKISLEELKKSELEMKTSLLKQSKHIDSLKTNQIKFAESLQSTDKSYKEFDTKIDAAAKKLDERLNKLESKTNP